MVMIVLGMLLTSVSNIFFIVGKRAGYHYVYIKMNMKQAPTAIVGACFEFVLFYWLYVNFWGQQLICSVSFT